jgi:multiple sugar transport system substrate-binding protein
MSRRRFAQASVGAVAGAMAAPALVGARSSRYHPAMLQTNPVSGKVLMWVYPLAGADQAVNEQLWAEIASGFTAENPDAEVTVEVLPWAQRNEKLTTALAAGAGPDVGYLNDDFIPQHGGDGNLQPLDDVIGDDKADFTEHAINAMSVDGTLYAMPILGSVTTLIYNTKLFEQVGVTEYPATWEELLALGPTFRDAGIFLTSYAGSLEQTLNLSYFPLLWQAGGEVLNEDMTAAAFNGAEGLEALSFIKTLYDEQFIDQGEAVTPPPPGGGLVLEGKVAVLLNGDNATARQLAEKLGEESVRIGEPLKNKVQITSAEPMTQVLTSGGYMSPRASLEGLYKDDPILGEFEKYVSLMHGGIRHKQARPIISAVTPYIQAAFLGDQSPEDALATAADEVNRLLERG